MNKRFILLVESFTTGFYLKYIWILTTFITSFRNELHKGFKLPQFRLSEILQKSLKWIFHNFILCINV